MFESLANNRLPIGSKTPGKDMDEFDSNGNIREKHEAPLFLFPDEFQDYVGYAQSNLWKVIRRTVRVLRWRYAVGGPHDPFSSRGSEWSMDGTVWRPLPSRTNVYVWDEGLGVNARRTNATEIGDLVDDGFDESIGHELFREAWNQRTSNPRSSLIIVIAAAEAGIKELITTLQPQTSWLIENAPAPTLTSLLKNYLPKLPVKLKINGDVYPPPKWIMSTIDPAVTHRNKVVHLGRSAPPINQLDDIFLATKDILWMLDYYAGHPWAIEHLTPRTRSALGLN
jgi:hypothetical protein